MSYDRIIKVVWRDHALRMCSNLQQILCSEEFCDVSIVLDNKCILAHRVILAASSRKFRDRLRPCILGPTIWDLNATESLWLHPGENLTQFFTQLQYIISIIYCGWLELKVAEIPPLHATAKFLQFSEICELLQCVYATRATEVFPSTSVTHTTQCSTPSLLESSQTLIIPSSGAEHRNFSTRSNQLTLESTDSITSQSVSHQELSVVDIPPPDHSVHTSECVSQPGRICDGTVRVRPPCELQQTVVGSVIGANCDPLLCVEAMLQQQSDCHHESTLPQIFSTDRSVTDHASKQSLPANLEHWDSQCLEEVEPNLTAVDTYRQHEIPVLVSAEESTPLLRVRSDSELRSNDDASMNTTAVPKDSCYEEAGIPQSGFSYVPRLRLRNQFDLQQDCSSQGGLDTQVFVCGENSNACNVGSTGDTELSYQQSQDKLKNLGLMANVNASSMSVPFGATDSITLQQAMVPLLRVRPQYELHQQENDISVQQESMNVTTVHDSISAPAELIDKARPLSSIAPKYRVNQHENIIGITEIDTDVTQNKSSTQCDLVTNADSSNEEHSSPVLGQSSLPESLSVQDGAPLVRVRPQFELHCPWGIDSQASKTGTVFPGTSSQYWNIDLHSLGALSSPVEAQSTANNTEHEHTIGKHTAATDCSSQVGLVTDESYDQCRQLSPIPSVSCVPVDGTDLMSSFLLSPSTVGALSHLAETHVADSDVDMRVTPQDKCQYNSSTQEAASGKKWASNAFIIQKQSTVHTSKRRKKGIVIASDQACVCQICGYKFVRMSDLQRHITSTHTQRSDSDVNVAATVSTVDLSAVADIPSHEPSNGTKSSLACSSTSAPLTCAECGFAAVTDHELRLHSINRHRSISVKCRFCDQSFAPDESLYQHIRSFHPGRWIVLKQCLVCSFTNNVPSVVRRHMARVHRMDDHGELLPLSVKCDECDYATHSLSTLKLHIVRHHVSDKRFKCAECHYCTNAKQALSRHISIMHSGQKPFNCEICGFRAATLSRISRHRRVHTQERRHKCDECGAQYADRRRLREHMQCHALTPVPALFTCHICGTGFRRKDNMQAHINAKHSS